MSDIRDDARQEAERRWPSPNTGLYEGLIIGSLVLSSPPRKCDVRRLTCKERDDVLIDPGTGRPYERATVESGRADMTGKFGEPRIETLWSIDGSLIRDIRHPSPDGGTDRAPCEHYDETEARHGD